MRRHRSDSESSHLSHTHSSALTYESLPVQIRFPCMRLSSREQCWVAISLAERLLDRLRSFTSRKSLLLTSLVFPLFLIYMHQTLSFSPGYQHLLVTELATVLSLLCLIRPCCLWVDLLSGLALAASSVVHTLLAIGLFVSCAAAETWPDTNKGGFLLLYTLAFLSGLHTLHVFVPPFTTLGCVVEFVVRIVAGRVRMPRGTVQMPEKAEARVGVRLEREICSNRSCVLCMQEFEPGELAARPEKCKNPAHGVHLRCLIRSVRLGTECFCSVCQRKKDS